MRIYKKGYVYSGSRPYIFVSYSHKDKKEVLPVIDELQKKNYRVWYDKGVEGGKDWPDYVAEHLEKSRCVLAFLSQNAADSDNCCDEISYAKELKKPLIVIYLEEFDLPSGLSMQLVRRHAIYKNRIKKFDDFMETLLNSSVLTPCKEDLSRIYKNLGNNKNEEKNAKDEVDSDLFSTDNSSNNEERQRESILKELDNYIETLSNSKNQEINSKPKKKEKSIDERILETYEDLLKPYNSDSDKK